MTEETIKITTSTMWKGIAGIIFLGLVLSIYTGGFGVGGETNAVPTPNYPSAAPSAPTPTAAVAAGNINLEGAHIQGDEDATVTIVEYSDFQCPFCGRFYDQTLSQIKSEYIDTGKVKFVYKHYPLGFHANAQSTALASECAGEQGKFFEFHDAAFAGGTTALDDNTLSGYAKDLGLDMDQYDSCVSSQKYLAKVNADLAEGQANGITGTPGFLINGKLLSGAQPFSAFKAAIEAELN